MFLRHSVRGPRNRALFNSFEFSHTRRIPSCESFHLQYTWYGLQRVNPIVDFTYHASSSSKRWQIRQGKDKFAINAKVQGLKSRAAFKLLEVCTAASTLGVSMLRRDIRLMKNTRSSRQAKQSWIWYEAFHLYHSRTEIARDMLQDHGPRYVRLVRQTQQHKLT